MTFQDIFNEVMEARFKASQTTSIKRWINLREAQIWTAAEWPWKIVTGTSLAVTSGDSTPTPPSDIQTPLAVYNDYGYRIEFLPQVEFNEIYIPRDVSNTTGRPETFTWNNGVLTLGDVPQQSYTYTIDYLRSLSHFNDAGVVTEGPMSLDDDYPIFGSEWHEILTLGALSTGLKVENDPTWESLEQEFGFMLGLMKEHYLPSVAVAGNTQFGADTL